MSTSSIPQSSGVVSSVVPPEGGINPIITSPATDIPSTQSLDLRASVEALLMQASDTASAATSLLLVSEQHHESIRERTLDTTVQKETTGIDAKLKGIATDPDLVATLLAVLQQKPDDINQSTTTSQVSTTGKSSSYSTEGLQALTPSTTSVSPTPSASDAETSVESTATFKADATPPSHLLGESWSGLTDLLSTLLASTSAATDPNNVLQSAFSNTTSPLLESERVPELLSPDQSASSILSSLSSSLAASLASPGCGSLTSGLSGALMPDRHTVGDLGILSPTRTTSGLTTPRAQTTSGMTSPTTSSDCLKIEDSNGASELVMPIIPSGLGTDPFGGTRLLSPSSKSKALSGAGTPVGTNSRTTTDELLEQFEGLGSGADLTPSGSNRGTMVSDTTPRSLLFHLDGSLNLEFFKVYSCKNESHVHDRKNCPFYHSQRDRRRQPVTYNAEQCEDHFDLEGDFACLNGDRCDKCHNRHELLYHPDIYKQRFCSSYNHLECHRGRFCAFAHTRDEIRCDLFSEEEERMPKSDFFMKKFKTLWCPYGVQHDWHGCLYAHTYQDCRRSPCIGYGSEPCPYWQKDLHSADYQKRCPFGPRCPYSHGSKEQLYHPAYYKTMPCADYKTKKTCPRSDLCAFYHDVSEKRSALQLSPSATSTPTASKTLETSSTPNASTTLVEEIDSAKLYDYTRPIPTNLMKLLQPNFMRPPLFNLDDFEAFGHASRVGSGRRESNSSTHRSGQNSPPSGNRLIGFPSPGWPESSSYPPIHQQSFFRQGMTPANVSSRGSGGSAHPAYTNRVFHNQAGPYQQPLCHPMYQSFGSSGRSCHRQQFMPNSPQMSSPFPNHLRPGNDDRLPPYSESFQNRRLHSRQPWSPNSTSPMPMSAPGRSRDRRILEPSKHLNDDDSHSTVPSF